MAYSTSGYPTLTGVVASEVEDVEEVIWYAGEIGCDDVEVREVGCGVGEVGAATDGLPSTVDGLLSSPKFGDGEWGGVGEEVGAGDEDPYVMKMHPVLPQHLQPTHTRR